jgi:hypothetical protein
MSKSFFDYHTSLFFLVVGGRFVKMSKSDNNQFRGRNPHFKISNSTRINKATKEFILGSNIVFNHTIA